MIDERAIIHSSAKIAKNVQIGPWTVIGPHVEINADTWIGSHVIIKSHTKIGQNNKIYQFASLGEDPQHLNYLQEETWLEIGDNNIIREFCTLNRGTAQGHGTTRIGNNNFLMAYVHIAHDCQVKNHTIFVNNASLAGHVQVDNYATIGGFVGIHQFCKVGAYSFISKAAMVVQNVLPYVLVSGNSAAVCGLNTVGLKRHNFSEKTIRNLRRAYNIIYRRNLTVQQAIIELQVMLKDCPEVQGFIDALQDAPRGVVR